MIYVLLCSHLEMKKKVYDSSLAKISLILFYLSHSEFFHKFIFEFALPRQVKIDKKLKVY